VYGLYNFCNNYKEDKLHNSALIKVAKGKFMQHKGYKCRYYDEIKDKDVPMWEECK
jgi:hypothetical protein